MGHQVSFAGDDWKKLEHSRRLEILEEGGGTDSLARVGFAGELAALSGTQIYDAVQTQPLCPLH
jgi:hypothetical protein